MTNADIIQLTVRRMVYSLDEAEEVYRFTQSPQSLQITTEQLERMEAGVLEARVRAMIQRTAARP